LYIHADHHQLEVKMLEGLQRLAAVGASVIVVSTGVMETAKKLYDSIGFQEKGTGCCGMKEILG
jgi:ABC-type multidrug transport system ATPase subunit